MNLTRPPAKQFDEEVMMEGTLPNISLVVVNMPDVFPLIGPDGKKTMAIGEVAHN